MRGATGAFAGRSITCPLSSLSLWSAGGCRRGPSGMVSCAAKRTGKIISKSCANVLSRG